MKKLLLLIFILFIIITTIYVYEFLRNPTIKILLPDHHSIKTGGPLLFNDIQIGTIISIEKQTHKLNDRIMEAEVAKIRLKGDIYRLIYKEDTFYIDEGNIIVKTAQDRKTPLTRKHLIKGYFYKGVFARILSPFIGSFRQDLSLALNDHIRQLNQYLGGRPENQKAVQIINNVRDRIHNFTPGAKDEISRNKDELLHYLDEQIKDLKEHGAQEAARILTELKDGIIDRFNEEAE